MIRLSFKRLLNRKGSTLTFLIALTALFALIPFGLQQSRDTKLAVDHSITEYGRGTYDLLVRPGGSRTETEKQLGVVEDNYIGDSQGGISISEWEELKEMEGIEVAAPVASLGYFRGNQMSIELPNLPQSTRFTWQFFTSDGLTKYPISEPESLVYFEETETGSIQYIADPDLKQRSFGDRFMTVIMPPNYYLLVAIDIESEEQLTGIDFSAFHNADKPFWLSALKKNYGDPHVVKVLKRDGLTIPLFMKIKAETLDVELEDYLEAFNLQESEWLMSIPDKEKLRNMFDMLQDEPIVEETEKEVDLSSLQSPFNGTPIQLNEAFEPSLIERYQADQDTAVYYVAKKIDYANLDQETPAVEIVKEGSPPAYKEVEQKGVSIYGATELPFVLFQAGTFSPKEQTNYLAASPLGIYGDMEAKTIDGQTLVPTTVPGSFISAPASGVTTLDSAEIIKGDKPIDAIRVRVAGIEGYDEEAQEKIDQVAKRLLEMGYEVDVVAGASFQEMTLDVEGIGFVNEQWTTLGVAQELGETWNSVTLLTTGLFVIFGILWVMARLTFEKNVLRGENDLLFTLGWGKTRIQLRNGLEYVIVVTIAFVLSLLILYGMEIEKGLYGVPALLYVFSLTVITVVLFASDRTNIRAEKYRRFPSILYYIRLIVPAMMILFLAFLLISIQIATLGHSIQESSLTSLGSYMMDLTFWLQVMVLFSTFVLAVISISDSLNTLLMERKDEFNMYHLIGWTRGRIKTHLLKEVGIWSVISILTGLILSSISLYVLKVSVLWVLTGLLITVTLFLVMIFLIVLTRRI